MVTGDLHAFPGGVYAPVQHEQKLTCWRADRRIGRCAPVPPADPGRRSFDELAQLRAPKAAVRQCSVERVCAVEDGLFRVCVGGHDSG
jgi:hypothetical protein